MPHGVPPVRSHITLAGATLLHAFTHAYGALLVPLYLMMVQDLRLPGAKAASLIVTIYMLVYCLGSYAAGMLADRFDRRWLLGIGLIGNAVAILGMGLVRQYEALMALGVMAGLFGTLFHPCANALIPAHYPKKAGLAIGVMGAGAGLGFFLGPQFAGWRATTATWEWGAVADWQKPLVEFGAIGIVCGVLFILTARETRPRRSRRREGGPLAAQSAASAIRPNPQASQPIPADPAIVSPAIDNPALAAAAAAHSTPAQPALAAANPGGTWSAAALATADDDPQVEAIGPGRLLAEDLNPEYEPHTRTLLTPRLRWRVVWLSLILGGRDFAGVASMTLSSLFLQQALGYDVRRAGLTLGAMMLMGVVANPLAVMVSPGRWRLPVLAVILVLGGLIVATTPFWPAAWVLPVLILFQMCQLGSYAISDAAMMERVHPDVRGRVVGLFLTLAGTGAALSPLAMGAWVDALGVRGGDPLAYGPLYGTLGGLMILSALSCPIIARLKEG